MFHYVATVRDADIAPADMSLRAVTHEARSGPSLVGPAPTLRFFRDRMILIAAPHEEHQLKWCSFRVGDVVLRAVRAGDVIETTRGGRGGIAICVFRARTLAIAVGHLRMASLGPVVTVRHNGTGGPDGRIEVSIGAEKRELRDREAAALANYDVYVDAIDDAVMSIVVAEDAAIVHSARRSAALIGADDAFEDLLRGERVDGTYIRAARKIP
jgi:hypothetical protein